MRHLPCMKRSLRHMGASDSVGPTARKRRMSCRGHTNVHGRQRNIRYSGTTSWGLVQDRPPGLHHATTGCREVARVDAAVRGLERSRAGWEEAPGGQREEGKAAPGPNPVECWSTWAETPTIDSPPAPRPWPVYPPAAAGFRGPTARRGWGPASAHSCQRWRAAPGFRSRNLQRRQM